MIERQPLKQMYTKWGKQLDRERPLQEHPRPQLKRERWQNLNGIWKYAILDGKPGSIPTVFDGEIVVPFSPESLLSGVNRELEPGQTLWYQRAVKFEAKEGERILLHFGAVDQCCTVYCNGKKAGTHEGGYWPFGLDISNLVKNGENVVSLSVTDDTDKGIHAYGKQKQNRGEIWYTPQSGIWQTVWVEYVPKIYIKNIKITPLYDEASVEIAISLSEGGCEAGVQVDILEGKAVAAQRKVRKNNVRIRLQDFKSWSPEHPFLYTVHITAGEDTVETYFGMRKFGTILDKDGYLRLALNDRPIFHTGLLDQGYWSDGLYTAADDAAIVQELTEIKRLGFNMLRKHIKIEPMRWYYHCDRLGILVWQDFVNGGSPYYSMFIQKLPFIGIGMKDKHYGLLGRKQKKGREIFEVNMIETVETLYNVVSLAVWVPFNEAWGQFDAVRITEALRKLDDTRLIDHASGWYDQGAGDFHSIHVYYRRFRMKPDKLGRVQALTEFGGYSRPTKDHMASQRLFGYQMYKNKKELTEAYERLYRSEVLPTVPKGLSAAVYTQVSDVEDEINGLFTYDRSELKLEETVVQEINRKLTGKDFMPC